MTEKNNNNCAEPQEQERDQRSVSQEQIDIWKRGHRKVFSITVDDDGEKVEGWFTRPDMQTISAVAAVAKKDEIKASNVLFDACWLGGSELMRSDAVVKLSAMNVLSALITQKQAELKNW